MDIFHSTSIIYSTPVDYGFSGPISMPAFTYDVSIKSVKGNLVIRSYKYLPIILNKMTFKSDEGQNHVVSIDNGKFGDLFKFAKLEVPMFWEINEKLPEMNKDFEGNSNIEPFQNSGSTFL